MFPLKYLKIVGLGILVCRENMEEGLKLGVIKWNGGNVRECGDKHDI